MIEWRMSVTSSKLIVVAYHRTNPHKMHLMYTADANGNRIYTLKKMTATGAITKSAHPARFSPDDKFSRHRVTIKKRYGLLPTQLPAKPM